MEKAATAHNNIPYHNNGVKPLLVEFRNKAATLLHEHSSLVIRPVYLTDETTDLPIDTLEWVDVSLATKYELTRFNEMCVDHEQVDKRMIQLTVSETFPDGQKSVNVWFYRPGDAGLTRQALAMTREQKTDMEAKFAGQKQDGNSGIRFYVSADTSHALELELLISVLDTASESFVVQKN